MILDKIVAYKREFVECRKHAAPLADIKSRVLDLPVPASFAAAIHRGAEDDVNVIAEVKKASPSKGIIREDFYPTRIAVEYATSGADAISVLTDEEFFKGHLDYLREIRTELDEVPLLRKDFTIDEYQIWEAREAGAAAILLIAGILDRYQITDYRELATELGMAALTEVHLEAEADLVAELGTRMIGVNNRDLRSFEVDLRQTEKIIRLLGGVQPGFIFVAESGISKPEHVDYLRGIGVDAILVGEAFMREEKPGEALLKLLRRDEQSLDLEAEVRERVQRGDTEPEGKRSA